MIPRRLPPPLLCLCAAGLLVALAPRADDLPSPDAVALGQLVLPRALVEGYREGVAREVIDLTLGPAPQSPEQSARRARARAALTPMLEEAFPPEFLAGVAAQLLSRRYSADELRTLRAREESPLGCKVRQLEAQAASSRPAPAGARESRGDAGAPPTFSAKERKELEAFAASPLGRKVDEVTPELARHFLEELDRRWVQVKDEMEPRMRRAAQEAAPVGAGER